LFVLSFFIVLLFHKNEKIFYFSFAQNRFQIFDVDISTFVAPEKSSNLTKNAIHV